MPYPCQGHNHTDQRRLLLPDPMNCHQLFRSGFQDAFQASEPVQQLMGQRIGIAPGFGILQQKFQDLVILKVFKSLVTDKTRPHFFAMTGMNVFIHSLSPPVVSPDIQAGLFFIFPQGSHGSAVRGFDFILCHCYRMVVQPLHID